MITYKQADFDCLDIYDRIPMRLTVTRVLRVSKFGRGLEGIRYEFDEIDVEPYVIDFDEGESTTRWAKDFNTTNWAIFMAYDGEIPVGGTVVAAKTPEIRMLDGRDDITVLWDIRVHESYKHQGIGQQLFKLACDWSKKNDYRKMKIECQNTNLPACKFYEKQGAELSVINENAYGTDEVMFLWYIAL